MGVTIMKPKGKTGKTVFLVGLLFILFTGLSGAQQYPSRPINLLVNFVPGGTVDAKKTLEETYLRFQRIIRELGIPAQPEKK